MASNKHNQFSTRNIQTYKSQIEELEREIEAIKQNIAQVSQQTSVSTDTFLAALISPAIRRDAIASRHQHIHAVIKLQNDLAHKQAQHHHLCDLLHDHPEHDALILRFEREKMRQWEQELQERSLSRQAKQLDLEERQAALEAQLEKKRKQEQLKDIEHQLALLNQQHQKLLDEMHA